MGATCISCKAVLGVYVAANVQNIYGTAVFEKLKTKGVEIGAHLASWILSLAFFLREESSCYFSEEETFAEFAIKVCTHHSVVWLHRRATTEQHSEFKWNKIGEKVDFLFDWVFWIFIGSCLILYTQFNRCSLKLWTTATGPTSKLSC